MTEKRVYTFGNGKAEGKADMRNLLGGKGANLAEMNLIGGLFQRGSTIPTNVGTDFSGKARDTSLGFLNNDVGALVPQLGG